MKNVPTEIEDIINTANELVCNGSTRASCSVRIAAAFVLNQMEYIPSDLTEKEAWDSLGEEWKKLIKQASTQYKDLLVN